MKLKITIQLNLRENGRATCSTTQYFSTSIDIPFAPTPEIPIVLDGRSFSFRDYIYWDHKEKSFIHHVFYGYNNIAEIKAAAKDLKKTGWKKS